MMDLATLSTPVSGLSLTSQLDRREQIAWLEVSLAMEPQVKMTTLERLEHGLYIREIYIPKGTILIGKIHIQGHVSVIAKGDITIMTETGTERIVGPRILVSAPGTKRVGWANEDTIWTTIHAAPPGTDLGSIEESLTTRIYPELCIKSEEGGQLCLSLL